MTFCTKGLHQLTLIYVIFINSAIRACAKKLYENVVDKSFISCQCTSPHGLVIKCLRIKIMFVSKMLSVRGPFHVYYLTIRPVAFEGEGSNCFSITQLVGQKRQ